MKPIRKIFLSVCLLAGLQFGTSSCVGPAYVGVDTGVYYGPRPWFGDGVWLDGGDRWRGGGRANFDVHPPGFRR